MQMSWWKRSHSWWRLSAGFMSCLDYSVFTPKVSSDCTLYTCLLRSVCLHKLLWLTEKHLCLCVLPWRQGHPNSRPEERRRSSDGVAMWERLRKAWQSAHSLGPGFLSRKISVSVGGRGQAVHKQRRGGIYSSACCAWPQRRRNSTRDRKKNGLLSCLTFEKLNYLEAFFVCHMWPQNQS